MSIILHGMLGRAVRAEGLMALMVENCRTCSAFPDEIKPLKFELDALVTTVSQLIDVFDKATHKQEANK
jgi:hypothetical protein